jgi:hypothetical protein
MKHATALAMVPHASRHVEALQQELHALSSIAEHCSSSLWMGVSICSHNSLVIDAVAKDGFTT